MEKDLFDDTFLARWLSDSISEEELARFKNHPDYHKYIMIKETSNRIFFESYDVNNAFEELKAKKKTNNSSKVISLYKYIGAIAASVILLVGFALFYNNTNRYTTNIAEIETIKLPDGSEMLLHSSSTAQIDKNWDKNRNIDLEGEAYFKVTKGKKFTVKTSLGTVQVLGTQFTVQTIGENFFNVKCFEGKVRVSTPEYTKILLPGEGLQWIKGKVEPLNFSNQQPYWVSNATISFDKTPLNIVLKSIEYHYDIEISNPEKIMDSVLFTGNYTKKDINKALYTIFSTVGVNYELKNNKVRILP